MREPRREPFELCILGGATEAAYRRLRPEVARMPWSKLDPRRHPPSVVESAKRVWALAAYQEQRTGASCAAALQLLVASRAPLDLVVMGARFPVDEMAHVELCSRLVMQLGGPPAMQYEPEEMLVGPPAHHRVTLQCAERMVRTFCVGEAVSVPLLRLSSKRATHPLLKAVLARIAKDEAAHGRFGFIYLDWVLDQLASEEIEYLARAAGNEIAKLERNWKYIARTPSADSETLGWLPRSEYLAAAYSSLTHEVLTPLSARGLTIPFTPPTPAPVSRS